MGPSPAWLQLPSGMGRVAPAWRRCKRRVVERPQGPVNAEDILGLMHRRWRREDRTCAGPWRSRCMAVTAMAMTVTPDWTMARLFALTPAEVVTHAPAMPWRAWFWVRKWLRMRGMTQRGSWLTLTGSSVLKRGHWMSVYCAVRRMTGRGLGELLRASW